MQNLATREYDYKIDEIVKAELEAAHIPVICLPQYMNGEVKTRYVGYLHGFVFYRAWSYWDCQGDMPLVFAKELYEKHKDLKIRAGGHAGNVPPEEVAYNPIYEQQLREYYHKVGSIVFRENATNVIHDDPTQPHFVNLYNIDTTEGLEVFVRFIQENNIFVGSVQNQAILSSESSTDAYTVFANMIKADMKANDISYNCARDRVFAMIEDKVYKKVKGE